MKIGFYSNDIQFEPDSLTTRGLGGSESALINLTREWKKNNPEDKIIVYNNNSGKYKEYNDVIWKTILDFQIEQRSFDLDVLISLRDPSIFYTPYIDAKLKILWSEDNMQESRLQELKNNKYAITNIDKIFVISKFAYDDIKKSFPDSDIQIIRNGYNNTWISSKMVHRPIAVYTSTPFRGLDLLADFWPQIYEGCDKRNVLPTLRIYSGMSLYGQSDDMFKNLYTRLSKMEGVDIYPPIPQKELYKELQEASVMLYPNTHTETGCMAVTEALANGLWVVTTNKGALGEQVVTGDNGFLIDLDPNSPEYRDTFISYAITALVNKPVPYNDGLIFTWSEQANKMRESLEKKL